LDQVTRPQRHYVLKELQILWRWDDQQLLDGGIYKVIKRFIIGFLLLLGNCATTSLPSSVVITRERGLHVLTVNPKLYPKETKGFDLIFNGFPWHRYRVGEKIMLVKVSGLPNSVSLTPLDKNGTPLEAATVFEL
jgi:hypothetical protein